MDKTNNIAYIILLYTIFVFYIYDFILGYQVVYNLTLRTQAILSSSLYHELSTRHAKYTHFRSFLTQNSPNECNHFNYFSRILSASSV